MTDPWNAAKAASRRPLRKPIKMHGPVGPTIVVNSDNGSAVVNGVQMSGRQVFGLGVDVPELGISAYGPNGGKRGDGLVTCKDCGYQLCSCALKPAMTWPEAAEPMLSELQRAAAEATWAGGMNSVMRGEQVKRVGSTDTCKHGMGNGVGCILCLEGQQFFLELEAKAGHEIKVNPGPIPLPVPVRISGYWYFGVNGLVKA